MASIDGTRCDGYKVPRDVRPSALLLLTGSIVSATGPLPGTDRVQRLGSGQTNFPVLLPVSRSHVCLSGMTSYLDGLPAYSYEMPCGHSFRTFARSVADERDGFHWFWCRQCRSYAALTEKDARTYETPPLHPSGMRMSDNQLAVRINAAVQKDRVAQYYRVYWGAESLDKVSAKLGIARNLVKAVALDMGVYDSYWS